MYSLPKEMWKIHTDLCSGVLLTRSLVLFHTEDSGLKFLWWTSWTIKECSHIVKLSCVNKYSVITTQRTYFQEPVTVWYHRSYISEWRCKSCFRTPYILHMHVIIIVLFSNSVESPVSVPLVNIFPSLMFSFSNPKSVLSVSNFYHLRLSSV